jgi:eukaryotic-like serine/threonine-protein kinase
MLLSVQRGEAFGRFRIVDLIDRGGMAEVYLATIEGPGGFAREIALKLPLAHLAGEAEVGALFIDEARLASRLRHRNVAAILELGEEAGRHYIAMEYVSGTSLRRLLDVLRELDRPLPAEVALTVAAELAAGLHHAHTARDAGGRPLGIVHRDVSPSNVLLSDQGEVKLVDFGIAKATMRSRHTEGRVIKGKVAYMSPEQANLREVGPPADQFALGAVLFEMLAGRRLYEGATDLEVLDRARQADLAAVKEASDLAGQPVLRRMLAPDPNERYGDLEEARAALVGALHELGPERNDDGRRRALAELVALCPDVGRARALGSTAPTRRIGGGGGEGEGQREREPERESWRERGAEGSVTEPVKPGAGRGRGRAGWLLAGLGLGVGAAVAVASFGREASRSPPDSPPPPASSSAATI